MRPYGACGSRKISMGGQWWGEETSHCFLSPAGQGGGAASGNAEVVCCRDPMLLSHLVGAVEGAGCAAFHCHDLGIDLHF